ncbi:vesicle coat protein [Xylaria cf. heliscus]|nr:vesicle coat protein [Xylaria cf. heliscus]
MAVADRPAVVSLLTMDIQLCLAHYCDLHGPTPLMVTEGLPVPCARCRDDNLDDMARPRSSAASATSAPSAGPPTAVTDALRKINLGMGRSASATVSEQDAQTHRTALLRASKLATNPANPATANASVVQTPPQSPRKPADTFPEPGAVPTTSRRDPSFQRTYDEYAEKRASPCANCALTLPKRQDGQKAADTKSEIQDPTMRTRAPYARVYGSLADTSPPCSNPQSSYPSDAEEETSPKNPVTRASSRRRPATSTSHSSAMSKGSMPHHTHYLDYTSTHEPTVPTTYTIVRASCLRTLSFETLPRRPEATQSTPSLLGPAPCGPPPFPSAMNVGPGYITAPPTPQSAASGGPIFFGDPSAGYTTAYIFRIPDMHARGRKRVYAFLALSTHRERLAMKAFSFISAAFRDLAAWIQELVEAEAEREREREEEGSAVAALNAAYRSSGFGGRGPHDSGIGLARGHGGIGNTERSKDRDRNNSSFLTGGSRSGYMQRMGGSMGPSGFTPKARGLAELAGLPDFFIELHTRFVKLLLELGIVLGS